MMKKSVFLLVINVILLIIGCGQKKQKKDVAIIVNGYEISAEEVKRAAELLKESLIRVFPEKAINGFDPLELSCDAAQQLISHRVMVDEAKKLGIKADKNSVDSSFETIRNRFPTPQLFEEELKKAGETDSSFKAQISESYCVNELIKKRVERVPTIDSNECKNFYEKNKDKYIGKGRVKVRWILFPLVNVKKEEERQSVKAKAKEAREIIKSGKMSFKDCAKKYSTGVGAMVEDGEKNWFKSGELKPELESVLANIKKGDLSEVIETDVGLFILQKLDEEEKRQLTFEEVYPEIKFFLEMKSRNKVIENFIDSLIGVSKIVYVDKTLKSKDTTKALNPLESLN